jgi:hypothetical protein
MYKSYQLRIFFECPVPATKTTLLLPAAIQFSVSGTSRAQLR